MSANDRVGDTAHCIPPLVSEGVAHLSSTDPDGYDLRVCDRLRHAATHPTTFASCFAHVWRSTNTHRAMAGNTIVANRKSCTPMGNGGSTDSSTADTTASSRYDADSIWFSLGSVYGCTR